MQPSDDHSASVNGDFHKTINAAGDWVLTGQVTIVYRGQITTVVAAHDGGVYYTVTKQADPTVVLRQQCVDSLSSIPQLNQLQFTLQSMVSAGSGQQSLPASCVDPAASWSFQFDGLSMVLCEVRGSFIVQGPSFSGEVFNIQTTTESSPYVVPQNATSGTAMSCPSVFLTVPSGTGATSSSAARRYERRLYADALTHISADWASQLIQATPAHLQLVAVVLTFPITVV